jgi:hypothetical protein
MMAPAARGDDEGRDARHPRPGWIVDRLRSGADDKDSLFVEKV